MFEKPEMKMVEFEVEDIMTVSETNDSSDYDMIEWDV